MPKLHISDLIARPSSSLRLSSFPASPALTTTSLIARRCLRWRPLLCAVIALVPLVIAPGANAQPIAGKPPIVLATGDRFATFVAEAAQRFGIPATWIYAVMRAGGLVIMNLMLISISQRTGEIGLRRAVGARASDITRQFLLESIFITLAGGVAGVALGLAIASGVEAAGLAASRVTWVSFAIALLVCTVIGLGFGVYPARKAAHLDPATSLRGRTG